MSGELVGWSPTCVTQLIMVYDTSTYPAEVETDAGRAFVKLMGNPQGPHALVCELVGTRLAAWLGLETFDLRVFDFDEVVPIRFLDGSNAERGPAIALRRVDGDVWSGAAGDLVEMRNPNDLAGLVVLDTWTRNCDRYSVDGEHVRRNYRNVFLRWLADIEPGPRLVAMDHTACFTCGGSLTPRVGDIDRVRDDRLYGLFPEFVQFVTEAAVRPFSERLGRIDPAGILQIVEEIPAAWQINEDVRGALASLIVDRARFLADGFLLKRLADECAWAAVEGASAT